MLDASTRSFHPWRATVAARGLLLAAAAACVALLVHRVEYWLSAYDSSIGLGLVAAVVTGGLGLVLIAVRGNALVVRRLAVELVLLGVGLLMVETLLVLHAPRAGPSSARAREHLERASAAAELGIRFDGRTASEVVNDLRAKGIDALPPVARNWPEDPRLRASLPGGFYSLSNASSATIVECNESGEFLTYRSDSYGFNNAAGLGDSRSLDVAVIGESGAIGHCVPAGASLVGRIRDVFPLTANFALAGSYPLADLATLREYVQPLEPRLVLWTLHAETLHSSEESRDPVLLRYLAEPGFSQGLRHRQPEVDAAIRGLLFSRQIANDAALRAELERAPPARWRQVLKFAQVRAGFGPGEEWSRWMRVSKDSHQFVEVMRAVRAAVDSWDGRLVVVLLPQFGEVVGGRQAVSIRHKRLSALVRSLDIEVIDGAALFRRHPDPARLFALRMSGHPNGAGYEVLAREVLDALHEQLPGRYSNAKVRVP